MGGSIHWTLRSHSDYKQMTRSLSNYSCFLYSIVTENAFDWSGRRGTRARGHGVRRVNTCCKTTSFVNNAALSFGLSSIQDISYLTNSQRPHNRPLLVYIWLTCTECLSWPTVQHPWHVKVFAFLWGIQQNKIVHNKISGRKHCTGVKWSFESERTKWHWRHTDVTHWIRWVWLQFAAIWFGFDVLITDFWVNLSYLLC